MDREKLRRRLLGIILRELPTHCAVLMDANERAARDEATTSVDRATFRRAAHSIKGAARSVGAPEIEQVGLELERMFANLQREERAMNQTERQVCERGLAEIERGRVLLETEHRANEESSITASATPSSEAPAVVTEENGIRALVVDDTVASRQLLRMILESGNMTVFDVNDGAAALHFLADHVVDVVVSDVNMPVMDGHALARAIRASEALRNLPVLLLTGMESESDRNAAIRAGADDCIGKTRADRLHLLEAVRRVCAKHS